MTEDVVFYVNGPARLLMACVIAQELYPGASKRLILLHQFGYRYDALLPHVRDRFDAIQVLRQKARRYSHLDHLLGTYLHPYPSLRGVLGPRSTLILFGLRSPAQKHLIRRAKRVGARVEVYAEGVAVERYFRPLRGDGLLRGALRRLLPRAFDHQHDYDVFWMLNPDIYRDSPHRPKLGRMFDLYGSPSFREFAEVLTRGVDLAGIEGHDTVLLGQPLSNFDGALSREEEERILRRIVGDRRVLVLPHPNERTGEGLRKYDVLPNAQVLAAGVPSELLLLRLRPATTITYSSNAAINYAIMNPASTNYFYPIFRDRHEMLLKHRLSLPNIVVSGECVMRDYPGG